jgi:hypothetical protein
VFGWHALLPCLLLAGSCAILPACGSNDPGRARDGGADMTGDMPAPSDTADAGDGPSPGDASDVGDAASDASALLNLMPLKPGNRWEYQVREPGLAPYQKTQTVEPLEPVGGRGPNADQLAFRMVTTKLGGAFGLPDKTVSWQRTEGTKIVRFREIAYRAGSDVVNSEEYWDPYKLRLDGQPLPPAPLTTGQRWEERYTEYKVAIATGAVTSMNHVDVWNVSAASVSVKVPAGTFSGCVELTKTDGTGTDTGKTYVFCPGVGKVRELGRAGMAQSEELTSFTVVP